MLNLLSADTVFLSLLQESPSLWHFMTTRRGQKTTSASGKEKGSRLSTARKSLQLLIRQPAALGRNASFPFYHCLKEEAAAGRGTDRASHFRGGKSGSLYMGKKCLGFIIWSKLEPQINLLYFSLWKYSIRKIIFSCYTKLGSPNMDN